MPSTRLLVAATALAVPLIVPFIGSPAAATGAADTSISVTDATGTVIELDAPIQNIVCITEPCVDALAELGITPVATAASRTAALPEFFGETGAAISAVGGSFFEPNIEDILIAEPDLVIGLAGVHEPVREALGDVPLYVVEILTPEDAVAFLVDVGTMTGTGELAEQIGTEFTAKLDAATAERRDDVTVVSLYLGAYGFNVNSVGESVFAEMFSRVADYPFAAEDAADNSGGYAAWSLEQLLEVDPDYIFVASIGDDGGQGDPTAEVMAGDVVWSALGAVDAGNVIDVRTPLWQYGRGTRSLSLVLDEFLAAID